MNYEVNLENLTPEEQEQFNALVEKANKPKSKVWKPADREDYYTVKLSGTYIWVDDDIDDFNYSIGNCFKTKEEAEFALKRLKVITEMRRYIVEHDDVELDWSNSTQEKCILIYNYPLKLISVDSFNLIQGIETSLYASSREIMKNMIKEIGEDRIKKYYFGVE